MFTEVSFKIYFLIVFVPFFSLWLWKFLLTGFKRDSVYTRREGILSAFLFRLLQTASFIGIILYFVYPSWINWANITMPAFLRFIGFPLGVILLVLIFWAFKSLADNYYASLNIKEDHELVTNGLYAWIRHPLYVLFLLIWICFFLLSSNYFIGLTGIMSYIVIFIGRVPKEEQLLRDRFGTNYDNYRKETGLFLPRLKETRRKS